MARAKSRRPRGAARGSAPVIPDIVSVGRAVARPEIIGTALVVLAAAAIPYLLPLTGVFGAARDALVTLFGTLAGLGVEAFDFFRYWQDGKVAAQWRGGLGAPV